MKRSYKIVISSLLCLLVFSTTLNAQYKFYTGRDWVKIDGKPYSKIVKMRMKSIILISIHDASIFSGTPIISPDEKNFEQYIPIIDNFYSKTDNWDLPLYFALKIAGMKKRGIPEMQINVYKTAVQKKLAQFKRKG